MLEKNKIENVNLLYSYSSINVFTVSHLYAEHKSSRYTCTHCDQQFYYPAELKRHIKSKHTDPKTWEHLCDDCGRAFPSKSRLAVHMRSAYSRSYGST